MKAYLGAEPVSYIYFNNVQLYPETVDYSKQYLTFEIVGAGDIVVRTVGIIGKKSIQCSINGGNWETIYLSTLRKSGVIDGLVPGDIIRLRGNNSTYAQSNLNYINITGSATFNIYGNIMSLVAGTRYDETDRLESDYTFCGLFKGSGCLSAENLILPATTITKSCYRAMFAKSSLNVAPKILPATILADACYYYMFEDCNIEFAPILPALTVPKEGYGNMFNGCTNLQYIECLATDISAPSATINWTKGIEKFGVLMKNPEMKGWKRGESAVPTEWDIDDSTL